MLINLLKCVNLNTLNNYVDDLDLSQYPPSPKKEDGSYYAPGFMGIFRTGQFQEFDQPGTFSFTVPDNITRIRARVLARGGTGSAYYGGGGGGYAHGVLSVTPGEIFTIKIPDLRANALTQSEIGTTKRGILIRATNGGNGVGGIGYGGDYQSTGGSTNGASVDRNIAGAAGGNQLTKIAGRVGNGTNYTSYGGAGAKGNNLIGNGVYAGGAVTDASLTANGLGMSLDGLQLPSGFPRFPLDGLYGDGDSVLPGAGGTANNYPGVVGGCGNKVPVAGTVVYGGGLHNSIRSNVNITTRGLVIIEW